MWFLYQFTAIFFWAAMNVVDSLLVRHFQKNPFVLGWFLSCISLMMLFLISVFFDVATPWMWWIILAGITGWVGDLVFYRTIRELDVSIANIGWSIMAILMGVAGFFLFGERWSGIQLIGAALVLGGIVLLSLWHRKIENPRSLLWLVALGCSYVPFYIFQKALLIQGVDLMTVFFWMFIGREVTTMTVPLLVPSLRRHIFRYASKAPKSFYLWSTLAIFLFMAGNFLTTAAFASGPVSLVSVVGNAQPFIVLFFAWVLVKVAPMVAPKELLTKQSVLVKILSFTIVFSGLALIALAQ